MRVWFPLTPDGTHWELRSRRRQRVLGSVLRVETDAGPVYLAESTCNHKTIVDTRMDDAGARLYYAVGNCEECLGRYTVGAGQPS